MQIIKLKKRLLFEDTNYYADLFEKVKNAKEPILIDMSMVEFFNSSVLGVLLNARQYAEKNGGFIRFKFSDHVREILLKIDALCFFEDSKC